MANYQWRATTTFKSDTQLSYGVIPNNFNTWQTDTIGTPEGDTWDYWYRDTNTPHYDPQGHIYFVDADSSRVVVNVTDSWSTSVDAMNNLTVTITTTVNYIVRDDLRGSNNNNYGRTISIYRQQGGAIVWSGNDYILDAAHTILASPGVSLGTRTIVIPPGQVSNYTPSIYLHNQVIGESSYDDIWIGVQFRNILEAPITFSLNYNANGGTGAPATQSTVAITSATFTVSNGTPTWGSYEFLGWSRTKYTDSRTEADVEYVGGDTITLQRTAPNVTLYAVWRMVYVPGKTLDASTGIWYSHNRKPDGSAKLWNGSNWTSNMETIGGDGARTGNPPSIYGNNDWRNMRKIGQGA